MEEEKVVLPETGQEIQDRRHMPGRRAEDWARPPRMGTARAFFWALIGSVVVLYLFFVAIGGIDPDEARVATIVILVLALAWLAHSWRRLWAGGFVSRVDRERRGY